MFDTHLLTYIPQGLPSLPKASSSEHMSIQNGDSIDSFAPDDFNYYLEETLPVPDEIPAKTKSSDDFAWMKDVTDDDDDVEYVPPSKIKSVAEPKARGRPKRARSRKRCKDNKDDN